MNPTLRKLAGPALYATIAGLSAYQAGAGILGSVIAALITLKTAIPSVRPVNPPAQ